MKLIWEAFLVRKFLAKSNTHHILGLKKLIWDALFVRNFLAKAHHILVIKLIWSPILAPLLLTRVH